MVYFAYSITVSLDSVLAQGGHRHVLSHRCRFIVAKPHSCLYFTGRLRVSRLLRCTTNSLRSSQCLQTTYLNSRTCSTFLEPGGDVGRYTEMCNLLIRNKVRFLLFGEVCCLRSGASLALLRPRKHQAVVNNMKCYANRLKTTGYSGSYPREYERCACI